MKLVRDKIPALITDNRTTVIFKVVKNPDELNHFINEKLFEEVKELITTDKDSFMEEVADILEVIETMGKQIYGFDKSNFWEKVFREKAAKKVLKGGFDKKIVLIDIIRKDG